ncbi:hypothetical protein EDD18DRAFT_1101821 [Armillaria luteobubalina]|uniref:Uncharacterized protein n=1 Tax=Armillaria luteobubalina TaxID=153913 RepID=A0AA39TUC2_9AGAR|nr:hypothetical protein EDD18DRAFT_1101821 [Armillaria luteobubalina]
MGSLPQSVIPHIIHSTEATNRFVVSWGWRQLEYADSLRLGSIIGIIGIEIVDPVSLRVKQILMDDSQLADNLQMVAMAFGYADSSKSCILAASRNQASRGAKWENKADIRGYLLLPLLQGEYAATKVTNTLEDIFLRIVVCWFARFPIEEEDNDYFFDEQPGLVDQMKRLIVKKIHGTLEVASAT